jgi:hypothetical protein
MEEQIQEYLYNPTVGKIGFFYWHRSNLDVNKSNSKESFRKLKTNNRYKAKIQYFHWLFLTIIL